MKGSSVLSNKAKKCKIRLNGFSCINLKGTFLMMKGTLISIGLIMFVVLNRMPPSLLRGYYDYSRKASVAAESLQQQKGELLQSAMEMESIRETLGNLEQKDIGMTSTKPQQGEIAPPVTKEEDDDNNHHEEIIKQLEKQQKDNQQEALRGVIKTLEQQLQDVSSKQEDLQKSKEEAHNEEMIKRLEKQESKIQHWNYQQQKQQQPTEDTTTVTTDDNNDNNKKQDKEEEKKPEHKLRHHKHHSSSSYDGDIPKHIHLIYVSKGLGMRQTNETGFSANLDLYDTPKPQTPPIPQATLDIYEKWKRLHPDWEVTLWDDQKVRQWLGGIEQEQNQTELLLDHLSRIPIIAWMTDLLRFVILEQIGGIYVDADILPLRNMDPLLSWMNDENKGGTQGRKHKGAFSVCQDEQPSDTMYEIPIKPDPPSSSQIFYYDWSLENTSCTNCTCQVINNAVIGAKPHHPTVAAMKAKGVLRSMEWINNERIMEKMGLFRHKILKIAGPVAWTNTIADQEEKKKKKKATATIGATTSLEEEEGVHILRSKAFFPCHYGKRHCRNHPDLYTPEYSKDPSIFGHHLYTRSWETTR